MTVQEQLLDFHDYTILVVDDEAANLGVLSELLNAMGCTILIARDGESCLEKIALAQPDLILLDILLPGIDGFEVCRQLKAAQPTASIPVIFMTALKNIEDKIKGFEVGGVDYITKPFQYQEVFERVKLHLTSHAMRKQLLEQNKQLEIAYQELEELGKVKDEFVANVSHELRTPIGSLMVYQEALATYPDKTSEYLPIMQRETERLKGIIEDLLSLSHLDWGQPETKRESLNLNHLVSLYVEDRQMLASDKNLRLTCRIDENLPTTLADIGLIGQVLGILLTNAFNYTPAGGQIAVRTAQAHIDGKAYIGFSVNDTGPGISEEDQSRIFERFFRGHTGRRSSASGTGLGLAIAAEIISQHDGHIEVESQNRSRNGTTFRVWLPVFHP